MNSYAGNRENVNQLALEASSVAVAVLQLDHFEGIASDLLELLAGHVSESVRKQEEWPKSARGLSGALRRIAPNLRAAGVEVTFSREATPRRRRLITIKRIPIPTVHTVQTVHSDDSPESNVPGINSLQELSPLDAKRIDPDANHPALDATAPTRDAGWTEPPRQEPLSLQQLDGVDGTDAKIPGSPTPVRKDAPDVPAEAAIPVGSTDDDSEIIE